MWGYQITTNSMLNTSTVLVFQKIIFKNAWGAKRVEMLSMRTADNIPVEHLIIGEVMWNMKILL